MHKGLFALALGGLCIGVTEFVTMGILPDLAYALHISIPHAGYLIAAYAFGVVVGAPTIVIFVNRYSQRNILIILMAAIAIFNLCTAISSNYYIILLTRFLSGLPHGAFFGIGAVVASKLGAANKKTQSIAIMFAGLTAAIMLCAPIGTFIGHHYSWRYSYFIVVALALLTIYAIYRFIPQVPGNKSANIKQSLLFLTHINSWLIILIIAIGNGGLFAWLSYIAPMLIHITHINANNIVYFMILAGTGMFIGNILGGMVADRYSPAIAVGYTFIVMTLLLIMIFFTAKFFIATIIITFITGMVAFAVTAPLQILIMQSAGSSAESFASAISQACFNIGNALGASLGGIPLLYGLSYDTPELVGAGMTGCGILLILIFIAKNSHYFIRSQPIKP